MKSRRYRQLTNPLTTPVHSMKLIHSLCILKRLTGHPIPAYVATSFSKAQPATSWLPWYRLAPPIRIPITAKNIIIIKTLQIKETCSKDKDTLSHYHVHVHVQPGRSDSLSGCGLHQVWGWLRWACRDSRLVTGDFRWAWRGTITRSTGIIHHSHVSYAPRWYCEVVCMTV